MRKTSHYARIALGMVFALVLTLVKRFLVAVMLVAGCTFRSAQTIVEIRAEASIAAQATELRIEVRDHAQMLVLQKDISTIARDFPGYPLILPISATQGTGHGAFTLRVVASESRRQPDGSINVRVVAENRIRSGFLPATVVRVPLWLLPGCTCDGERERCVPDRNQDQVPECDPIDYELASVDAGVDERNAEVVDASDIRVADAQDTNVADASDHDTAFDGATACQEPNRMCGSACAVCPRDPDRVGTICSSTSCVLTTSLPLNWHAVATPLGPPARYSSSMAFDSDRQRVVLFGGVSLVSGAMTHLNDLWEWDGATWSRSTAVGPSAREGCAIAYDRVRHVTVVFGGAGPSSTYFNDTWEWDGTAWAMRMPTASPSARFSRAAAYDIRRARVVFFGGTFGSNAYLNDMWEWDGMSWSMLSPMASPGIRTSRMVYDSLAQNLLIFGGATTGASLDETWTFENNTWTMLNPAQRPTARVPGAFAFDRDRARTFLFGGGTSSGTYSADTWSWDGTTWSPLQPAMSPPARSGSSMVYDEARHQMVLFGGLTSNSLSLNDTWIFGPESP